MKQAFIMTTWTSTSNLTSRLSTLVGVDFDSELPRAYSVRHPSSRVVVVTVTVTPVCSVLLRLLVAGEVVVLGP
eukprot:3059851-Rhodomonas_salina.3